MTKHIMTFCTIVFFLLVTQGCGGGSDSNSGVDSADESVTITLEAGESYVVYPGDRLVKNTDDTVVKITHTENHPESTVQLIAGSATIIRN